jgi:lipid-binding SYLF domain-containing protein
MRTVHSLLIVAAVGLLSSAAASAQSADEEKLAQAATVLQEFAADEKQGIPIELLQRARGIAVIPNLIRGGFFVGGRRGRGVLTVRSPSGEWSNPAFITLTGGSIGWQFGAEAADVVLVFANDRSVSNIASGKLTFGGDATAIAGPIGRRSTAAVTFRSEVYIYMRSRGLFAGAAFEGARLDVDQQSSASFYSADSRAQPLGEQNAGTPASVLRFLETLQAAASLGAAPVSSEATGAEEAIIYPLEETPQ